ncbi:MAG: amino acid deaminase [Burkholderiaceae bacterium]|nr:amino acid deaminase [Burkholderiaceae bacterium]
MLSEIDSTLLDGRCKGLPGHVSRLALGAVPAQGWNVLAEDLPLPLAVLHESALRHNAAWMKEFLARTGAVVAPHGKTTMSPQLFQRQIDDGAWAMTVATIQQLQVARYYGFERIVLANQLVGRQAIGYVLDELARDPKFEFFSLVDSVAQVQVLARAAAARDPGRPLRVLLECGFHGGRTGVRDLSAALAVARAVASSPQLSLVGVEGFEGLMSGPDAGEKVAAFLDFLVEVARAVEANDLFAPGPVLLSAGGSAYYDVVTAKFRAAGLRRDTTILTRSGCYITHDCGTYAEHFEQAVQRSPHLRSIGEGPRAAIEVWAYVQSCPEPGRALVTMGKRDVSHDAHLPAALRWYRPGAEPRVPQPLTNHSCIGLNDQHGYLKLPHDSPLQVGDMVGFGISHPCLTFDKWPVMMLVDDDYDIIGAIRTFF